MSRNLSCTLALIALLVLAVSPVLATDVETSDTAPAAIEAPTLEDLPAEPPNVTPAPEEDLEIPVEPGQDLFFHAIRACTSQEKQQCPPECHCIFIRNEVNCFC